MRYSSSVQNVCVKETATMGKGVFSTCHIKQGDKIFSYEPGKIVHVSEVSQLTEWEQNHVDELDDDLREVLVEPACFVNHSCEPTAILKGREYYALQDLDPEEEITVDYRTKAYDDFEWDCTCDSENCTGKVLHSFFSLSPDLQKMYLPYTLINIQEEYAKRNSNETA